MTFLGMVRGKVQNILDGRKAHRSKPRHIRIAHAHVVDQES